VAKAYGVAPQPWSPWLETRDGIGGCSFVQYGSDRDQDNDMYLEVRLGDRRLTSPDGDLDAIVDFVGNAAEDVLRLVDEAKRLRGQH
jgi:hypothetical protein